MSSTVRGHRLVTRINPDGTKVEEERLVQYRSKEGTLYFYDKDDKQHELEVDEWGRPYYYARPEKAAGKGKRK